MVLQLRFKRFTFLQYFVLQNKFILLAVVTDLVLYRETNSVFEDR